MAFAAQNDEDEHANGRPNPDRYDGREEASD